MARPGSKDNSPMPTRSGFQAMFAGFVAPSRPSRLAPREAEDQFDDYGMPECAGLFLDLAQRKAFVVSDGECSNSTCVCEINHDTFDQSCLDANCGSRLHLAAQAGFSSYCEYWETASTPPGRSSTKSSTIESPSSSNVVSTTVSPTPSTSQLPSQTSSSGEAASTTGDAGSGQSNDTVGTDPDQGQLSNGAKAGIGVGAGLGVLIMLAALILIWRRKRRQNAESSDFTAPDDPQMAELEEGGRHELDDSRKSGGYIGPKPISGIVPAELED